MFRNRIKLIATVLIWGTMACATGGGRQAGGGGEVDGLAVRVSEETYLVEGLTLADVMEELRWKGPLVDGRHVHASTEWSLTWTYQVTPGAAGCHLSDVVVSLDMVVTLPRWMDRDRSPSRDGAAQWDRFLRDLHSHESHHQQVARDEAGLLLAALRTLTHPECTVLSQNAVAEARSHQARLDARQRALDGGGGTR